MLELNWPIKKIMTEQVVCANESTIMSEVAELFEMNEFHHLPIINNLKKVVGIISKSDYYKLQDRMTLFDVGKHEERNKKIFGSLLASEVMREPITIHENAPIADAIELFLANVIHSLIVTKEECCIGILTPHDILKQLVTDSKFIEN